MKFKFSFICSIAILAFLFVGCDKKAPETQTQSSSPEPEEKDINSITVRPELAARLKIGQPTFIDLADKILVPSRVQVDEERTAQIGSYVTGRIINMFVILGDYVKAGDRLARITSPDLTQAQLAYLRALSRVIVTQKASDRARHLLAADVIPLAEVERRQSELEIAQAELSAATDQLKLFGMADQELNELKKQGKILPWMDIKATREGYVIARNVIVGQVVQPSDPLFQVADLSHVWVVGDVPEQIARDVRLGQHVEIDVPAIGITNFDGVIIFVSDTINRQTRTVMTRVLVENSERKLKPDMLANMHITDPQHKSLVVPEGAVVRELNQDYVFVKVSPGHFRRVPVKLGPEVANFRAVINGLTIDQRIVMEGAFHLDSERKLAELE
ncbi:efflux RND transporter periplasmic adaptor subunit [Nitrosomonas sp. JL21]|uniref:efflux RND transporter periplasmic adaptor subunit n=1 Tax=Nitrosomonas sp. JL21 TaxID=153949 RepID=UPI00136B0247|nr:efflux RND transporter periplasmic adaptor subunit [Nitrosomonas sp. JL21]MBL8497619.1 efflux RND transporter periplasmic adaptor subunit [Nitrosomonas sp.]MCC7092284.1 efflux RND transporter periplasmic adaptor subunit [Nitrosomonas sp.]MXS77784.1 efflux RND transporter periplasmic adaptor subunit [Nitrosomonas sp. JL21]